MVVEAASMPLVADAGKSPGVGFWKAGVGSCDLIGRGAGWGDAAADVRDEAYGSGAFIGRAWALRGSAPVRGSSCAGGAGFSISVSVPTGEVLAAAVLRFGGFGRRGSLSGGTA